MDLGDSREMFIEAPYPNLCNVWTSMCLAVACAQHVRADRHDATSLYFMQIDGDPVSSTDRLPLIK